MSDDRHWSIEYILVDGHSRPEWSFEEGLALCRSLVAPLKIIDAWPALGGSVLNNGRSLKDVDILILPWNRGAKKSDVLATLNELGWKFVRDAADTYTKGREVGVWQTPCGRRADVMLVDWDKNNE